MINNYSNKSSLGKANVLEMAWLFLLLGSLSFTHRTATESLSATLDLTHLLRFAFDGCALLMVLLGSNRIPRPKFDPINIFFLYAILGITSTLWSASPVGTLGKSGEIFISVVIILKTLELPDSLVRLRRLLGILIFFYTAMLTYSLAGFIVFPEMFSIFSHGLFERQMATDFISANGIANVGALLALIYLARYLSADSENKNIKYFLLFVYFSAFPVLAQGRTGMVTLVIGVFLLLLRTRTVSTIFLGPLFAGGVIYSIWATLNALFLRGQDQNMLLSLTGRTVLWERAWQAFLNDPLLGNGFGVGSRVMFLNNSDGFGDTISHVHNGFLEVLLGTGLVGFLIWIIAFVCGAKLAVSSYVRKKDLDIVIGFLYLITNTIMSTGVGGWMSIAIGYFLVSTAYLVSKKRSERAQQREFKMQGIKAHAL